MNKAIELPIADCNIKVSVGTDGVWLQLGEYTSFHVANTLGNKGHIIGGNVNRWCLEREEQAKEIINAQPSQPSV